jgi:hypothetical protein
VKEGKSPRKNRRATTPALKGIHLLYTDGMWHHSLEGLRKEGSAGGRDDVRQGCQRSPCSRLWPVGVTAWGRS